MCTQFVMTSLMHMMDEAGAGDLLEAACPPSWEALLPPQSPGHGQGHNGGDATFDDDNASTYSSVQAEEAPEPPGEQQEG